MFSFFNRSNTVKGDRNENLPKENHDFPDSNSPHGLCPRCNKQSSFDLNGSLPATYSGDMIAGKGTLLLYDRVSSLICRNCLQPVIVLEEKYVGETNAKKGSATGMESWRGFFWWPFSNSVQSTEIPESIGSALKESKNTFSAQCYRASAAMARRTLEAIAVDKGVTTGTLFVRINTLKDNEIIDRNLKEWANEIRQIGNNGAHFDLINDVSRDDAKQIIVFIEELIRFIYVLPAEIQRRRNER